MRIVARKRFPPADRAAFAFAALLSAKRLSRSLGGIRTGLEVLLGTACGLVPLLASADTLIIDNVATDPSIWGSGIILEHVDGATDGYEGYPYDSTWGFPLPVAKIHSEVGGIELDKDSRDDESETPFHLLLSVVGTSVGGQAIPNELHFEFLNGPDPNRVYLAAIHCDGAYTPNGQPFETLVNIREVIADGGLVDLPGIQNVPDGQVYGTCDVFCDFKGPGDVDASGVVDGLDLTAILTSWDTTPGDPLWNPEADLDGSGVVDGLDLTEAISNWTVSSPPAAGANVVAGAGEASKSGAGASPTPRLLSRPFRANVSGPPPSQGPSPSHTRRFLETILLIPLEYTSYARHRG